MFQHIDCECFQNTRKEHVDIHDMVSFGKDKELEEKEILTKRRMFCEDFTKTNRKQKENEKSDWNDILNDAFSNTMQDIKVNLKPDIVFISRETRIVTDYGNC